MSELNQNHPSTIDAQAAAELCYEIADMIGKIEQKADHYQVLSISRRATAEHIKRAYRELSKKFHPDRHVELAGFHFQVKSELERIFARFQEAYEVLSDDTKRRKYDAAIYFPGTTGGAVVQTAPAAGALPANTPPAPEPEPEPSDDVAIFDGNAAAHLCFEIQDVVGQIKREDDYYQILQIGRRASTAEIQKAYTRLSRKFHPDRYSLLAQFHFQVQTELEMIYAKLQEAYETLTDENKRRRYDGKLRFAVTSSGNYRLSAFQPTGEPTADTAPPQTGAPTTGPPPTPPKVSPPVLPSSSTPASLNPPSVAPPRSTPPSGSSSPTAHALPAIPTNPIDSLSTSRPIASGSAKLSATEHYMLSIEHFGKNDIQTAYTHIHRAVEMKPRDAEYHAQFARILEWMPQGRKSAEEHYLLALDLEKDLPELKRLCEEVIEFYQNHKMTKHAEELQKRVQQIEGQLPGNPAPTEEAKAKPEKPSAWNRLGGQLKKLFSKGDS
ncbi:MAG: DnaJ domain-containing protein [Blastocatellia bacterium]|nr:DnaJ domain-containing protein [Blastocatellia bacterium]